VTAAGERHHLDADPRQAGELGVLGEHDRAAR
jgi:hypothetical protein